MSGEERWEGVLPAHLLREHRRLTIVGVSGTPGKDSHEVPAYMAAAGYDVVPINPHHPRVLGREAAPNLAAAPKPLGLVAVFRPSPEAAEHVREAIVHGAKAIWLPTDVASEEAKRLAGAANIPYVEDVCLRTVHQIYVAGR